MSITLGDLGSYQRDCQFDEAFATSFEECRFKDSTAGESTFDWYWQPNTGGCSVCSAKFNKWAMKFRHHCRNCGLCICGECSRMQAVNTGSCLSQWLVICKNCADSEQDQEVATAARAHATSYMVLAAAYAVDPGMSPGAASVEDMQVCYGHANIEKEGDPRAKPRALDEECVALPRALSYEGVLPCIAEIKSTKDHDVEQSTVASEGVKTFSIMSWSSQSLGGSPTCGSLVLDDPGEMSSAAACVEPLADGVYFSPI